MADAIGVIPTPQPMSSAFLLVAALLGLLVPGGLFLIWLFNDATSVSAALHDRFAMAFVTDVVGSTLVLGCFFARRPVGPLKWPWFLVFCFGGTLCFGIPFYLWLNRRLAETRGHRHTSSMGTTTR